MHNKHFDDSCEDVCDGVSMRSLRCSSDSDSDSDCESYSELESVAGEDCCDSSSSESSSCESSSSSDCSSSSSSSCPSSSSSSCDTTKDSCPRSCSSSSSSSDCSSSSSSSECSSESSESCEECPDLSEISDDGGYVKVCKEKCKDKCHDKHHEKKCKCGDKCQCNDEKNCGDKKCEDHRLYKQAEHQLENVKWSEEKWDFVAVDDAVHHAVPAPVVYQAVEQVNVDNYGAPSNKLRLVHVKATSTLARNVDVACIDAPYHIVLNLPLAQARVDGDTTFTRQLVIKSTQANVVQTIRAHGNELINERRTYDLRGKGYVILYEGQGVWYTLQ